MEMDFEKRRKDIIHQLEDIREQLIQSLDILEKFKARKVSEAKARAAVMNKLINPVIDEENIHNFKKISLN